MDNFSIDITSEGEIGPAMALAFKRHTTAVGYRVSATKGLIFYKYKHDSMIPFPFEMDASGAADFTTRWLAQAQYGREPDHGGDNGKGWRLYNENWGHIDSQYEAFVAVMPAWAQYGK